MQRRGRWQRFSISKVEFLFFNIQRKPVVYKYNCFVKPNKLRPVLVVVPIDIFALFLCYYHLPEGLITESINSPLGKCAIEKMHGI
jgi:hypothetical protein